MDYSYDFSISLLKTRSEGAGESCGHSSIDFYALLRATDVDPIKPLRAHFVHIKPHQSDLTGRRKRCAAFVFTPGRPAAPVAFPTLYATIWLRSRPDCLVLTWTGLNAGGTLKSPVRAGAEG